ncbi:uncharacterized protein [Dermacentor albipictus]|uniref:uncharacterized protein n=1 Tax=Dermacentor albipictus TaxID=60249 RepID=UPI0038FC330C
MNLNLRLGLLLSAPTLFLQLAFGCYTPLPPLGPRLFRAKALFGNAMRVCHDDIVATVKLFPSSQIRKMLDCVERDVQNKSAGVYTIAKLPYAVGPAFSRVLACVRDNFGDTPYEVFTDSRALAIKAIHSFGWT